MHRRGRNTLYKFPTPQLESDFIVDDANYFRTKACQCHRLAQQARGEGVAEILDDLARAFDRQAEMRGGGGPSG